MIKITVTPTQLAAALNYTTSNSAGALVVLNNAGMVEQLANYGTTGEYVWYVLTNPITAAALEAAGIPTSLQWPVQSIAN